MYFLSTFCCVCLKNNTNLLQKSSDISYKLSQCLNDVDWRFLPEFYICSLCEHKLNIAFEFRQTCLKSAESLRNYLKLLEKEGGAARKNLKVRLTENDISAKLLKDYISKNTVNSNTVLPSPKGAIVPGTNFILNPFTIYTTLPAHTVVPMVQEQPLTSLQSDLQINVGSHPTISFQQTNNLQLPTEDQYRDKSKSHTVSNPDIGPQATSFLNPIPQILIINKMPQLESAEIEQDDTLNNVEPEEMSILVDPLACILLDDKSDSNFSRAQSDNDAIEINEEPNLINYEPIQHQRYVCVKCNATFNNSRELSKHKKSNYDCRIRYFEKGSKSAQCLKCNRRFSTKQYLQKHLLHCNASNGKLTDSKNIVQQRTDQKVKKDDIYNTKNSILQYLLEKKKSDIFKLEEEELRNIDTIRMPCFNGQFQCGYCGHTYECSEYLIQHLASAHKDTKHFSCQFCNEKFINGMLLEDHLHSHYNYFKCSLCNKTFTDIREIPIHMINHHDIMEPLALCVSCNKEFKTKESLVEHSELHLKNLVFECYACKEKHKNLEELYVHISKHFHYISCLFCRKIFRSDFELKEHTHCEKYHNK